MEDGEFNDRPTCSRGPMAIDVVASQKYAEHRIKSKISGKVDLTWSKHRVRQRPLQNTCTLLPRSDGWTGPRGNGAHRSGLSGQIRLNQNSQYGPRMHTSMDEIAMNRILAVNPGSTSTKIAVYEDGKEILGKHPCRPEHRLAYKCNRPA